MANNNINKTNKNNQKGPSVNPYSHRPPTAKIITRRVPKIRTSIKQHKV